MDSNLSPYSIIGIACCGIYSAVENLNNFKSKTKDYIKRCQRGEMDSDFSNLVIELKISHNSVYYSIKIAIKSPNNEYVVVSGDAYSTFKVHFKDYNHYRVLWNGHTYHTLIEKKTDTFKITIDQHQVVHVKKTEDQFAKSSFIKFPSDANIQPGDLNSILDTCLSELDNILNGYVLPEPIFSNTLNLQLGKIFSILLDPLLPALQFQKYLDSICHVVSGNLLKDLELEIGQYTSNFSSLFSRFPSDKIKAIIENYLRNIENNTNRHDVSVTLRPMLELAEMYSDGIRGNTKYIIEKLLLDYLRVEIKFQDKETLINANVTNKNVTIADIISHNSLPEKNKLILSLFELVEKFVPGIILDLKSTIQRLLTYLKGSGYSKIIPKLREVLITGQIPSYEIRNNEMESIFLNSINGYHGGTQVTRLENLICSNSEVFDIIFDFFHHRKIEIRKCAMEVYVRRAYMVYELFSFEQSQMKNGQLCVLFKFSLPTNNKKQSLTGIEKKRSNSYVALTNRKMATTSRCSQPCANQIFVGSSEKDDLSDGDLPNEYYFPTDKQNQTSNDNDTDSAISIDACSLSELADSDFVCDNHKFNPSPSVLSLDRLCLSSNYSSLKDSLDSTDSTINLTTNRRVSMYYSNPPIIQDPCWHCDLGVMIIFDTMEEIERNLEAIRDLLLARESPLDHYDISAPNTDLSLPFKVVFKLILRDPLLTNKFDNEVAQILSDFCDKHLSFFDEIRAIRITFLLQSLDKTIRYFTFRNRKRFEEDVKLRNIDPILSFQLEINRLRNYQLDRLPVPNRRMYVYMGKCREVTVAITAPYRMFTRCIIHHKDFHSSTSNIEYMAKEAERNLMDAMDAFDMAWIDDRAHQTKSNHIFFYFHSILCIDKIEELENVVRAIIFKNGKRLWNLRITQAELKMSVKVDNGSITPIRLWVHNEGGKCLDICIYREEFQFKTDFKVLSSWSPNKEGRYHGVPVDCFYSI